MTCASDKAICLAAARSASQTLFEISAGPSVDWDFAVKFYINDKFEIVMQKACHGFVDTYKW